MAQKGDGQFCNFSNGNSWSPSNYVTCACPFHKRTWKVGKYVYKYHLSWSVRMYTTFTHPFLMRKGFAQNSTKNETNIFTAKQNFGSSYDYQIGKCLIYHDLKENCLQTSTFYLNFRVKRKSTIVHGQSARPWHRGGPQHQFIKYLRAAKQSFLADALIVLCKRANTVPRREGVQTQDSLEADRRRAPPRGSQAPQRKQVARFAGKPTP